MEYCPVCERPLNIVKSYLEIINDDTPEKVTEAYRCLSMACINTECSNYVGNDLSSPRTIVDTIRHREV